MRALNILQSSIKTDYDFLDKFKTDKELEDYILLAIKEVEDLIQENKTLIKTLKAMNEEMIKLRIENQELKECKRELLKRMVFEQKKLEEWNRNEI